MGDWSRDSGTVSATFQVGGPNGPPAAPMISIASVALLEAINPGSPAALSTGQRATVVGIGQYLLDLGSVATVDHYNVLSVAGGVGRWLVQLSAIGMIRMPIALATVSSTALIPAGAIVMSARLNIVTPYSAGTTISIGQAGSVSEFMATTDNNPGAAAVWINEQDTAAASANPVLVTISGAPAAGAGFVVVTYVISPGT